MRKSAIASLLAAVGCAFSASAQDSVSNIAGSLPGDGLGSWDASTQVTNYVLDLAPFQTSWGTVFGTGPVAKSSKASSAFSGSLISAQALSACTVDGICDVTREYSVWVDEAGTGVNPSANNAASTINLIGKTCQMGFGFAEFATSDSGADVMGIIGGVINVLPGDVSRLYVTRVSAAQNSGTGSTNQAQFGFGGADAFGNLAVRADDFGTGGDSITGNNYYRFDSLARTNGVINTIAGSGVGDPGATAHVLAGSADTYNTPGLLGEEVAGRPVITGSNFNIEYAYEQTAGSLTTTGAHLAGAVDQRGGVGISKAVCFDGSVATAGLLGYDANFDVKKLLLWGVDANGNVAGAMNIDMPATLTDNDDMFTLPGGYPGTTDDDSVPAPGEFGYYRSQIAFRGGNGSVTVGYDADGNCLVAAPFFWPVPDASNNPDGGIAVGRINENGTVDWTLAAYNYFYTSGGAVVGGKPILDGPNGNAIGQCTELLEVTGGSPIGPSFSPPMMDSAGNVWFIGAVELFDRIDMDGDGEPETSDFDSALLRAVYDSSTHSYQLELVMELGQIFTGVNSGVEYRVDFLGIADDNSASSGTAFSGNINQAACLNRDPSQFDSSDPRTLGGLVVSIAVTYDSNGDGMFDGDQGDEEYNVLQFVGPTSCDGEDLKCDQVDFAAPFGVINTADVLAYLNIFNAQTDGADFNCDGNVLTNDFIAFLNLYNECN